MSVATPLTFNPTGFDAGLVIALFIFASTIHQGVAVVTTAFLTMLDGFAGADFAVAVAVAFRLLLGVTLLTVLDFPAVAVAVAFRLLLGACVVCVFGLAVICGLDVTEAVVSMLFTAAPTGDIPPLIIDSLVVGPENIPASGNTVESYPDEIPISNELESPPPPMDGNESTMDDSAGVAASVLVVTAGIDAAALPSPPRPARGSPVSLVPDGVEFDMPSDSPSEFPPVDLITKYPTTSSTTPIAAAAQGCALIHAVIFCKDSFIFGRLPALLPALVFELQTFGACQEVRLPLRVP